MSLNNSHHPKLLIISSVWVEPNSSAAGSRMLQLIHVFLSHNYQITYASTASRSAFAQDLSVLGVKTVEIQLNHSSFDDFIIKLQPDTVLFDRFMMEEQFGWRVAEILPDALRILDTEDLHCLRQSRENALKKNKVFQEQYVLETEITKREIASILRCDLSLIISTYEMQLLKNTFKIDEKILHYMPFLLDNITINHIEKLPAFEDRTHFYFIGNFLHKPNYDAVLYLKKEIWPFISKIVPQSELHIYGAYPSQKITQLNNVTDRFFIKGTLLDISLLKKYKICLAPLRFGAGIKGKLTEAMQYGTPSITTAIGSEGMHGHLPWNGVVATEAKKIALAAVALYSDKKRWLQMQERGFKIINTLYDKEAYSSIFIDKINHIQADLKTHRAHNFLGALLHHHTLKSTKYLSKWIEEKNKKQKND